jgi:hypothetical protein
MPRLGGFLRGVCLHVPDLKPQAGKFERGTPHFTYSKHLDVESPRPFQIGADNRNRGRRMLPPVSNGAWKLREIAQLA